MGRGITWPGKVNVLLTVVDSWINIAAALGSETSCAVALVCAAIVEVYVPRVAEGLTATPNLNVAVFAAPIG